MVTEDRSVAARGWVRGAVGEGKRNYQGAW